MSEILGNATGGFGYPKTYILTDESGAEFTGVVVDQLTVFTATDNDVREGVVYASDHGVSTGTKVIPIYHAREGKKIIASNKELSITIEEYDLYDYTYLQCIICQWDTSMASSVVDIYKVIDNKVYQTGSNTVLASTTKDVETKTIKLGLVNTGDTPVVIRYCIYKEA